MRKIWLLIISILTLVFLPKEVFASNSCMTIKKESAIEINSIDLLENKLKEEINDLNNNDNKYVYNYELKIVNSKMIEEKKDFQNIKVESLFLNQEDAFYYFSKINSNDYIKGNYYIKRINNNTLGEKKTKICNNNECKEEIEELSKTPGFENLGIEKKEKSEEKEILYDNTFSTEKEANEFAKNNIPEGYSFVKSKITSDILLKYEDKTFYELMNENKFDTQEKALKKLKEFQEKYNGTGKIIENKKIIEENNWNETFSSLEDAMNKINFLTKQGYNLEYNIENSSKITGTVINAKKLDRSSKYELLDSDYILIKQGNYKLAVWTEKQLTEEDKNKFVESYNKNNHCDGSTSNIVKEQITFIYGYIEHNLSYLGKNWGTYKFSKDNNKIILECNKEKVSHIVYGMLEKSIYEYKVIGTYKKSILEYIINGTAQIAKEIKIYKVSAIYQKNYLEYILNYRINNYEYFYELSYDQYILDNYKLFDVDYEIRKCSYPNSIEDAVLPPHTAINAKNIYKLEILLILISLSFILLLIRKKHNIK